MGNADDRSGEQFLFSLVAVRCDSTDFRDDAGSFFLYQSRDRKCDELKGHLLGKIIFHIIYSIFIMVYLFIGIPYTTNTSFGNKLSVVIFTILQMLYLVFSSLQISYGYFLTHLSISH